MKALVILSTALFVVTTYGRSVINTGIVSDKLAVFNAATRWAMGVFVANRYYAYTLPNYKIIN